jgi:S-adenosylmethionine:tRNA ribosyltransferase-isomerase
MLLSDFDFDLPNDLIALRPAVPRTASRMLVAKDGQISDHHFSDIIKFLRPGDRLVLNDTRVIPARLAGQRVRHGDMGETLAGIGVNLLSMDECGHWLALAKPAKRVNVDEVIRFGDDLWAIVLDKSPRGLRLKFNVTGDDFDRALQLVGEMPLPPYIAAQRAADGRDIEDYQTVFAQNSGAVAAPTASLHFDDDLLKQLEQIGVTQTKVTLHVGAGTFLPVKVDDISEHVMHSEWGEVSENAAQEIAQTRIDGGRVIPVGTTALRLIETAARNGEIAPFVGDTDIFITPGFEFHATDGLITNFHLPKSTLLMLVSALMGMEKMQDIYAHAIENKYRFFSYGDASLLLP